MGLVLLFILCVVANVFGAIHPSFRSSLSEGGKPILRMGPELENSELDALTPSPDWVEDLRSKITCLLEEGGLKKSTPQIAKLVNDTEKKQNVLLRVEVYDNGATRINYKNVKRSASPDIVWPPTPAPDPEWLQEFKEIVKDAILENKDHGSVDGLIRQLVEYNEKVNNVIIDDVDVDDDGKLVVTWKKKPKLYG